MQFVVSTLFCTHAQFLIVRSYHDPRCLAAPWRCLLAFWLRRNTTGQRNVAEPGSGMLEYGKIGVQQQQKERARSRKKEEEAELDCSQPP